MFRNIKIAGLCLASMLVMGMALAGNASAAELLWLVCLEGSGLTKYESSTCLKASGTGKWQSLGVRAGQEITVKLLPLSILLIDNESPVGKVAIRCWDNSGQRGEGVIKSKGEGEIRVAEVTNPNTNCNDEEGRCTKILKVKAVGLPWITNIEKGENGEPLTTIKPHPEGEQPGWEVECEVLLVKSKDVCTSVAGKEEKLKLVNAFSATELLVLALFENAHKASCTASKKESGEVKGTIAILLPGGALSVNRE